MTRAGLGRKSYDASYDAGQCHKTIPPPSTTSARISNAFAARRNSAPSSNSLSCCGPDGTSTASRHKASHRERQNSANFRYSTGSIDITNLRARGDVGYTTLSRMGPNRNRGHGGCLFLYGHSAHGTPTPPPALVVHPQEARKTADYQGQQRGAAAHRLLPVQGAWPPHGAHPQCCCVHAPRHPYARPLIGLRVRRPSPSRPTPILSARRCNPLKPLPFPRRER